MKIRIEPYKRWSGGAKALGQRAGILRATPKQVQKHGNFSHIINWGSSERRFQGEYINNPEAVHQASDKKAAFIAFKEGSVPIPDFTTDRNVAKEWLDSGDHIVVRRLLRGSEGRGIVLVGPPDSEITDVHTLPTAPLFVKYVKKADEFRVHVFFGEVIDVQQKKRRTSVQDEDVDWQIRNHSRGWVFARSDVVCPDVVRGAAVGAVSALDLDFGAVDVGYNKHKGEACVYEVNTAPGLEGTTLESYYSALRSKYPALNGGMYAKRRAS